MRVPGDGLTGIEWLKGLVGCRRAGRWRPGAERPARRAGCASDRPRDPLRRGRRVSLSPEAGRFKKGKRGQCTRGTDLPHVFKHTRGRPARRLQASQRRGALRCQLLSSNRPLSVKNATHGHFWVEKCALPQGEAPEQFPQRAT